MELSAISLGKEKKRAKSLKASKQLTLDNLPNAPKRASVEATGLVQRKQIIITGIDTVTKEDELLLKVGFRLKPSKASFSKIRADLFFNEQKLNSVSITIPQSPLAADEFELTPVLDMKGINAGSHTIRVEMYELWSSGERLSCTSKEVTVEYAPQSKEDRLIKVPIVRSISGTDLAIVSDSEKDIYRQIEESMKRDSISRRDEW